MAMPVYVAGNYGDTIEIDTPDDISTATVKTFRFLRPDMTTVDVTASFTNTGTDGKLKVVTAVGFYFDQAGQWKVRAYVEMGSIKLRTIAADFHVAADLATPT